jgi:hypothetical protein
MSQTLPELRAELIRHQADCMAVDQKLNAATPGTPEYGKLRNERQRLGLAITTTRKLLSDASKGRQSSLL